MRVEDIELHVGPTDFEYTAIRQLEAKCEAATNFSSAPTVDQVNGKLRAMAASVGANAVIHVKYDSGVSFTSWRSMKGTGLAVQKLSDEMPCPTCAETIKRAATKCRFCNAAIVPAARQDTRAPAGRQAPPARSAASVMSQEPLKSNDNPAWVIALIAGAVIFFMIIANM